MRGTLAGGTYLWNGIEPFDIEATQNYRYAHLVLDLVETRQCLSFSIGFVLIYLLGLDPARPLIEQHASRAYRLTRDDANVVQIMHTNAGTLGQVAFTGSLDLCINGGMLQPFCRRGFRLSKLLLRICN